MKPKRIISLLLAICLVAGLLPQVAFAAGTDTGKAMQLGTSGISDPTSTQNSSGMYYMPSDYVYFGVKGSDPIKWRVLDADKTNDGTTSGMFLLSEYLLDRRVVFERAWNSNDNDGQSNPNEWQHSDAQNWCSTFATNTDVFSTAEQAAFLGVTKTDNSEGSLYSSGWGTSSLTENDKVFFLSVRELADYVGNYDGAPGLRATDTAQSAGPWWLRSPYANYAFNAGLVAGNGLVSLDYVYNDWAARPAFNLNLNSVLFTSAAVGGKTDSTVDGNLTSVADYTGNEWKLTLLDETREFAVTEQTVSGKPGDTITLNYTGATTGENEYISVIIADENGAQYYGRVAQPGGESGTATLSIPADLAPGSYTLNVFSEQYNGDYMTDYASAFAEVALTVEEAAAPGIDTGKAIQLVDSGTAANIGGGQADNIYFGTYQQSSDGNSGYNIDPIKWRVLENANGQLFLLSDQNLDVFQYHTDKESVTWESSTMRSWLNGYGVSENIGGDSGTDYTSDHFIGTAFSEKEQKAIAETEVVNDDNPTHGTEGGNDTTDQIFLLSIEEVQNADYGFANDSSRIATNTAYVAGGGKIGGYVNGVGKADYWWLRSPGKYDDLAADVTHKGGVFSYGLNVYGENLAVRPAFNLDLNSVLFTSAAEGGKSANGMDSGLTAIGNYAGNEWKLTLLDKSRDFSISNAAIEGSTVTFSYSNAKTGENEYISAVIENNGEITHYGRILQLDGTESGASGIARLTLPEDVTLSDTTKLYVFNEQYNGGEQDDTKLTDYASAFETVALTVSSDTTAPTLTPGSATRDSETAATVKFTSSEAGSYYYEVVNSGENQPTIDTDGTGTTCGTTEQTISLTNLSDTSAKDIYIVVKDAAGNVSDKLKIGIPAYVAPLYGISASPDALNFGSATEGYSSAPAAQTVTIQNTGNQTITLNQPAATDFNIGTLSTTDLAAGGTATFTVQPKTGLTAGSHSETLTIFGSNSTSASVGLSFEVLDTYTLTVNLNGGSGNTTNGVYPAGEVVNIDAGSRSNYRFTGWTTSNGGSFADASSASTTFTMPAADTTITANWEYNGGGGTGGSTTDYYRLTFDVNGGSEIASILRAEYTTVDLSDYKPTREGYEFTGWYADEDLTDKITSIRLTRNTTVYAGWEEKKENPGTGFENPFTDISENDWFYEDVMFVFANDLMVGTGDATFSPEISTSRAMIAVTLWRMEGEPAAKGENSYTDVENGAWYTEAITWANENGIAEGYGNGCFQPETPVTREQLAAFFYRYAAYKGYDITITGSLDHFNDKDNVSEWAKDTMAWAVGYGLIGGKDNNMLDPQGEATRAEFAAMLQRFCQKG